MTVESKEPKTKFPEPTSYWDLHWDSDWYEDYKVNDWFKHCIEDFPGYMDHYDIAKYDFIMVWFEKWFSQFDCSVPTRKT